MTWPTRAPDLNLCNFCLQTKIRQLIYISEIDIFEKIARTFNVATNLTTPGFHTVRQLLKYRSCVSKKNVNNLFLFQHLVLTIINYYFFDKILKSCTSLPSYTKYSLAKCSYQTNNKPLLRFSFTFIIP